MGLNSKETHFFPQKIQKFLGENQKIIDLDVGYNHSFLLTSNFSLFSFGGNSFGQLGNGSKLKQMIPKILAPLPEKPIKISCGFNFTLILTESGQIYSCGDNSCGQLGLGKALLNSNVPLLIKTNPETDAFIQISAGKHSAALTNCGILYIWGMSLLNNAYLPQSVENNSKKFKEISVGGDFGVGISTDGGIYVWGRNDNGELGLGDYTGRMELEENKYFIGKKLMKISCGENHAMAIGDNIVDYGSPSVMSISLEEDEEGLIEINELQTPVKKKEIKADRSKSKGKKYNKNEEKENLMETKKNLDFKRKELNEISLNDIQNKNREEKSTNFMVKGQENEGSCSELKRMNDILSKNVENLNEVLKTYLEDDSKNSKIGLNFLKKNEISENVENDKLDMDEKLIYLMGKLSERDHEVANMQLELSKKEALQHALLYKIRFLEESLKAKDMEIQNFKKNVKLI